MLGSAGGSDDGGMAFKPGDGALGGAVDADAFALVRAFGGALDKGVFPSTRGL